MAAEMITVEVDVKASIDKVWKYWTEAKHIIHWNFASEDWICPSASNDLKKGSEFNWRMEAKDGSMGFDFIGVYDEIEEHKWISYYISDERKVSIRFLPFENEIRITEYFEAEGTNSDEMQRAGWQAILNNFKKYVESN